MRSLKKYLVILAAAMSVAGALGSANAQGPEWGGSDDLPTWQTGDKWDFRRSFSIDIDGHLPIDGNPTIDLYLDLRLAVSDDYTLQVNNTTPTLNVNNGLGGFQTTRAYNRTRTTGQLTATFTGRLAVFDPTYGDDNTINVFVTFPAPLNSGTGTNWIGQSDLSQIREQFAVPNTTGTLLLKGRGPMGDNNAICQLLPILVAGISCGVPTAGIIGLDLAVDHAIVSADGATTSGLELLDFPHVDDSESDGTGEVWLSNGLRGIGGTVQLGVPGLLDPPTQFSFATDTTVAYDLALTSKAATDPDNLYPTGNHHVVGYAAPNNDDIYYSPAAKELSYWKIGNLQIPVDELLIALNNFTTKLRTAGGVVLGPNTDIGALVINPPIPQPGQAFTVSGTYDALALPPPTTINAEILVPGVGALTGSGIPLLGAFSINMTAPAQRDTTPHKVLPAPNFAKEKEWASYGILLSRDGAVNPYNQKVVTVRTFDPSLNAAKTWARYE